MKPLIFAISILLASGFVSAQDAGPEKVDGIDDLRFYQHETATVDQNTDETPSLKKLVKFRNPDWTPVPKPAFPQIKEPDWKPVKNQTFPQNHNGEKFDWKPAMWQSGLFLAMQHSIRILAEGKTRHELTGPFFRDWKESVRNLRDWDDGGKFFTNYIAHPLQGAITARIFINNSPRSKKQEFGKSGDYWKSRLKAMAWAAAWSVQFEIGPLSEASLGNVGQTLHADGRTKLSYIDFVLTPTLGVGFVVVEDILDKYVLKNWLEKTKAHRFLVRVVRCLLTPSLTFANPFRFRTPWTRDFRRV